MRGVHVGQECPQTTGQEEADDIVAQQTLQAPTLLAPLLSGIHGRRHLSHPGAADAVRQPDERQPSQHGAPEEVDDAGDQILVGSGPISVARVGTTRMHADVVLHRGDDSLDDTVRKELRPLEPDDVVYKLELVGRPMGHDQQENEPEEGDSDAIHRDQRDDRHDPENRILHLPKDGQVVGQVVVQDLGPHPAEAATRRRVA
mmetsp:Transcript_100482/g.290267  ORF Transcript_100482/g.290267 Transcript_100482/m.290267 type:complete len:202 (-) Transcript_100482:790-1395(-)